MKHRSIGWMVAMVCTCVFSVRAAQAGPTRYTIVEIPTLGGSENFGYAINDRGDVVGQSRQPGDRTTVGFLFKSGVTASLPARITVPQDINKRGQIATAVYENGILVPALYDSRNGRVTTLGSFGGVAANSYFNGTAVSVNDRGQVVGYSYLDNYNRHAFLYSDGVMIDLGSFGGYSGAMAINFSGEIAGFASDAASGYAHAFVFRDGAMREVNPFGGPNNESYARGINDRGAVVGDALVATGDHFHGFIFSDDTITDIGTLESGHESAAFAINDHDQVIGIATQRREEPCSDSPTGLCINTVWQGFLYEDGVITALNSLIPPDSGWDLTWATDINERGQITGYGLRDGRFRAFLMTVITEGD